MKKVFLTIIVLLAILGFFGYAFYNILKSLGDPVYDPPQRERPPTTENDYEEEIPIWPCPNPNGSCG